MKAIMKAAIRHEEGSILPLALVLLVLGGLLLIPLLGLMGTGLTSGQIYDEKMLEYYAADAGVENGVWHLQQGGSSNDTLQLMLNGKDVVVTMEHTNADFCNEPAIYEIVSTAASGDGPGTTVTAYVTGLGVYYVDFGGETIEFNIEIDGPLVLDSGEPMSGNVVAEGTVTLNHDASIDGAIIAGDDLTLNEGAAITGVVIVEGDLILNEGASIGGTVCVGGHLELHANSSVESDVYVGEYVKLEGGDPENPPGDESWIEGDVYARGLQTIDFEGTQGCSVVVGTCSWIGGNVWSGGKVKTANPCARIFGDVHVNNLPDDVVEAGPPGGTIIGDVSADYDDDWACALALIAGDLEILSWEIT
jgi:cytoskeletal protein CcmA (bactofilin family)